MLGSIFKIYYTQFSSQKDFYKKLYHLLGYYPSNISVYKQALLHNSVAEKVKGLKTKNNNERLEFLGDAVLDLIIAENLFKRFPFQGEGFLTEMRSKSVSRKKLSQIAIDMGIPDSLMYDKSINKNNAALRGISGNALEALIGAIYLDKGYRFTCKFIKKRMIIPHLDFEEMKETTENFKSLLNQYAQKERKDLEFKVLEENDSKNQKMYTIGVFIDGIEIAKARGKSKKVAEQLASEKTCQQLNLS
ncbi:MAG: ribonuclease [Bacteroidota bacterium]